MRTIFVVLVILMFAVVPAIADAIEDCNSDDAALRLRGCSELLTRTDISPGDRAVVLSRRADAHLVAGNLDAAIADRHEALKIEPEFAAHRSQLSQLYRIRAATAEAKNTNQALADYAQAIELDPSNHDAYAARASLRIAQKEYDKAIEDLASAMKLEPGSADYRTLLAKTHDVRSIEAMLKGDFDRAIDDLTRAIALHPSPSADSFLNRGSARSAKKDTEGAIADFSEAIRHNPNLAEAYVRRGELRQTNGKPSEALADFDEALKIEPRNVQALIRRGLLREELDQRDAAVEDYRTALTIEPANKVASARLGQLTGNAVKAPKAEVAVAIPKAPVPAANVAANWNWIKGTWRGQVVGLKGKRGDVRTLVVTAIGNDGTVSGRWAAGAGSGGGGSRMRISGNVLVIVTGFSNVITLRRAGSNGLAGSFDNRYHGQGRLSFTMARVSGAN